MADEVKKVLGLDAVSLIKADLLNEIKQESELITREYREAIENKANDILNNFETSSETDKQAILDQLTELGQKDETLAEGVESLRSAITSLNNKVDGLDQPESVLSDNDVKKIVTASLIQKSFWSNDSIGSPTVAGNEIVGLIGTFGKIKTENLEGTLIEGKTVQSIPDSEGNIAWQLNNAGNGHLANGNISWNENGDVTFGEGVKLTWNSDWDSKIPVVPEIPEGFTEEQIKEFATEITDNSLKTLTIDAAQITSGKITADQIDASVLTADAIIGEELVGKTIKSTENEWEIQDGGTAKFANNRVCFNADGSGWIGKRDNGMAVLSWKKDGTIEASNTTEYDASNAISGKMAVNPSTLFTAGIYLCSGDVKLEKTGSMLNRANLPAGVYTFVNTTGSAIKLTLPRFKNTTNRGLVITIPAYCGADVRFVYNSSGQFEFIPLVGATVEETLLT